MAITKHPSLLFWGAWKVLLRLWGGFNQALKDLCKALTRLIEVLEGCNTALNGLHEVLKSLIKALEGFNKALAGLKKALKDFIQAHDTHFTKTFQGLDED